MSTSTTMFILPLLACVYVGLSPVQDQKSNFSVAIEHPNPNNGYDDYVRATDLLDGSDVSAYLSWTSQDYARLLARKQEAGKTAGGADRWTEFDEGELGRAKELDGLGFLGVEKKVVDLCGGVLDVVRVGNRKAIWDPRTKADAATLYPEFAGFKKIAKLFCAEAYVRFADGNSRGGTDDLLEALTFARRVGGYNLISQLVSSACRALVFTAFEGQLSRLSAGDAERIVSYVDSALTEPNSYLQALRGEEAIQKASVDLVLKYPADMGALPYPGAESVQAYIDRLTPGQREAAESDLAGDIEDFYSKLAASLGEDESRWANIRDNDGLPTMPSSVTSVQGLADVLVRGMLPIHEQATLAEVLRRAQLRLLGLHARIIDFRWKNNRLPSELKEAVPAKLLDDPTSGKTFQYQLTADGGYKLFSKGVPATGPIELKYKRLSGSSGSGDDLGIPPP